MGGILDSGETNNTYCVGLCNVCLQDEVNIAINKGRTVNSRYPAGRDCFQGQYDQIGCRLPMSGETYSDLMSEATSSSLIPLKNLPSMIGFTTAPAVYTPILDGLSHDVFLR